MNDNRPAVDARQALLIDRICCDFEQALRQKQLPAIALYLDQAPRSLHAQLFRELIALEIDYARTDGRAVDRANYERQWPAYAEVIAELFANVPPPAKRPTPTPMNANSIFCQHCQGELPKHAKYCGYCGELLASEVKANEIADPPKPPIAITPAVVEPSAPLEKPAENVAKPPVEQIVSVSLPRPVRTQESKPASVNEVGQRPVTGGRIFLPHQVNVVSLDKPVAEERREARADIVSPNGSLRRMVLIPTGSFMMGSSSDQQGEDDERPQHRVNLSAYYIDQYAVSNIEYEQFDPNHRQLRDAASSGDDDPVVMVNYEHCIKYCRWRSLREGLPADTYTLPTEAQWERAARGGYPDRVYPWGNSIDASYCNTLETGRCRTLPVSSGVPNGFHLYFIGSNVREWCYDYYSPAYYQSEQAWDNPQGPPIDYLIYLRVTRGACYSDKATRLGRCAARGFTNPMNKQTDIGFRCVRLATM